MLAQFLKTTDKRFHAVRSILEARRIAQKIDYSEMSEIVAKWVDISFRLSDFDRRKMRRLARMQAARNARDQATPANSAASQASRPAS